jgi:hypothetical protein
MFACGKAPRKLRSSAATISLARRLSRACGHDIGRDETILAGRKDRLTININEFLRIRPSSSARLRRRLGIRIEEDHIGSDPFVFQRFSDLFGLGQEVKSNMLDPVALFLWEEFHHGLGWRAATGSPYFLPSLRTLEQHTHGVEARYAIGTSHDGSQVLDAMVEGWKIAEDALVLQRQAFGTHLEFLISLALSKRSSLGLRFLTA